MLTGLGNYKAGPLPPVAQGLALSRHGVIVTAFGPNPDGDGTLLRLWELAGTSGDCTVTLPEAMKAKAVQPVDLRGRSAGQLIPVKAGVFTAAVGAFAPASFLLQP
jgi:alpha-mannosidase